MYAGRIVEEGPAKPLFHHPHHPYTVGPAALRAAARRAAQREAADRSRACRPTSRTCRPAAPSRRAAAWPPTSAGGRCPTLFADGRRPPLRLLPLRQADAPRSCRRDGVQRTPSSATPGSSRAPAATATRWSRSRTCGSTSRSPAASSFSARSAPCTPSTASTSTITQGETLGPGRRERLRQDRPPAAPSCGSIRPTAGTCSTTAPTSPMLSGGALRRQRRHMQMIFQDPYAIAEPAHDGRRHHRRAAARPQASGRAASAKRSACGAARDWWASTRTPEPLPARVHRRPAPAHRHRPGARRRAQLHRLRRADQRARRLDPGADHQPAAGSAARVRPDLPVHRPRPLAWCATSATAWP